MTRHLQSVAEAALQDEASLPRRPSTAMRRSIASRMHASPRACARRSTAAWRWRVAEEATLRLEARLPRPTEDVASSLKDDATEEVALVELLATTLSIPSLPCLGVLGPQDLEDVEGWWKTISLTFSRIALKAIRLITCVPVSLLYATGLRVVSPTDCRPGLAHFFFTGVNATKIKMTSPIKEWT